MGRISKDVEMLRDKAYKAMGNGDYNAARTALNNLLPYARVEATELMVSLEIERGDETAAERELEKLWKLPGERTPYQRFLAARVSFLRRRVVEALKILEKIELSDTKPAYLEMIYNLFGQCYKFLGECEKSAESYLKASKSAVPCELAVMEYSNYLFNFHYLNSSIPEQRRAAEEYNRFFKDVEWYSHPVPFEEKRKLRIGYISPDLRKHVVLRFSYVFFERYNHERFEVFLYANCPEDDYSRHIASKVDCWRNISGYKPEEVAKIIKDDHIDILFDLAGHSKGNCLPVLAYKPAPIQISGIGYFASTGLKAVDYFLGDVHLDTEEAEEGFTEELLLLPDSHFCYAEMEIAEAGSEPPCRKNGYVTFGSFNNFTKVNNEVLKAWSTILKLLPEARLLLKANIFEREDSRELVLRRMEQAGIPLDRVETRADSNEYMSEYRDMDIALDTFPYPGGGTTCDALYMGVPVVTLRGKSHGERFGSSILENMGLEELCADSVENYVEIAVGLGRDLDLVAALYGNVRKMFRKSPVMNAALYMKNIEAAYEAVWERYVGENAGADFKGDGPGILENHIGTGFSHKSRKCRHDKIRIGYISPYFCKHIVSRFSNAFFQYFDSTSFDICGYNMGEVDEVTEHLQEKTFIWRNLKGIGAYDTAKQIYEDEIDILVDLSWGDSLNKSTVMQQHPAPIQIYGVSSATGCLRPFVNVNDAVLSVDESLIDDYEAVEWTSLKLPKSRLCYSAGRGVPSYIPPAPFSKSGHITFGCRTSVCGLTEDLLKTWNMILRQTGDSILLIKSHGGSAERERAEGILSELGFDMARVILEDEEKTNREYFDAYARMDILLDDCLQSDNGRGCDALYMGVPVITMFGGIAAEMLSCVGLKKLCGHSLEEYAAAAIALAGQEEELRDLHLTLRWRLENTPAMDGARYMAELEEAYGRLYSRWQRIGMSESDYVDLQKQTAAEEKAAFDNGHWESVIRKGLWLEWSNKSCNKVGADIATAYSMLKDYARGLYWCNKTWHDALENEQAVYQRVWNMQMLGYLPDTIALCNQALESGMIDHARSKQNEKAFDYRQPLHESCQSVSALPYGTSFASRLDSSGIHSRIASIRAHRGYLLGSKNADRYFWEAYKFAENESKKRNMYSGWLMSYNCCEDKDNDLLEKHKNYGRFFKGVQTYRHSKKRRHKKLRIGYLSPDFRWHVMQNFIFPFFQYADRTRFEVYAYNLADEEDLYTARFKALADRWRNVKSDTPELTAKQVYEDEIDILFDLAGHTEGSGLPALAWKPAPIQLSGLGYMATTGLYAVDYFLTDGFVDPVGEHEAAFVEKLLRVSSQFCYTRSRDNMPGTAGAPCCERGWVLFGVFNGYHKYTDEMLLAWREILFQVPKSKLLVKCQVLFPAVMKLEAYNRFKRLGFDMDRVIFEQATTDYMNRYLDVDIALDTYPYPGGGTTCDALYMGVPVISRYSDRHSTRFAYSILQNVGVGELATDSLEGYIERAVAVAKDWELLEYLHRNLRSMMEKSPVMDAKGYMREIEARYREIWERWLKSGRD